MATTVVDEPANLNSKRFQVQVDGASLPSASAKVTNDSNEKRITSSDDSAGASGEGDLNVKGNESLVSGTQRQVDDVQQVETSSRSQTATSDAVSRFNYVATTTATTTTPPRQRVAKIMRG